MAYLTAHCGEKLAKCPAFPCVSFLLSGQIHPYQISVSDFVRRAKGRLSRKIQQECEHIRKRYWGQRFWGREYFSTTSGNITDDAIMRYLDKHIKKDGLSHSP